MRSIRAFLMLLFLFALSVQGTLLAQNYLWPTSASKHLSSSFCEYRPAHFHSAIDIKTWGREGYPVFAVDDGKIFRIRVSPFGYGKALYLKLKDGRYAVYAHLKKFNKKLEQAILKRQIRQRRYSIDWYPEHWPVKKGELLAYTGQTGIGVPHLHFEIRDSHNHPLNPLMFYKKEIKDKIAPILQELLVIPLSANSLVNGSHLPQVIPLIKTGKNFYRLKDSLNAYGVIGLAVRSYDQTNGIYNHLTFYRAQLFFDQRKVFSLSYDTLNFARTRQADVAIYYPFKTLLHKRFRKMFIEPFNRLPFYSHSPGNGYLTITQGKHRFQLEVYDFFGNKSTVRGTIFAQNPRMPRIRFARKLQNFVFLKLMLPNNLLNLAFYSSDNSKNWNPVDYFEILNNQSSALGHILIIKANIKDPNDTFLRLDATLKNAQPYSCIIALKDSLPQTHFKIINAGKRWIAKAPAMPCSEGLRLVVQANEETQDNTLNICQSGLEAVLPPPMSSSDSLHIKLANFRSTLFDSSFRYYSLFPNKTQTFSFFADRVKLQSSAQTVYDTLLFTVKKSDSLLKINGIPILSPMYSFDWYPQIFRKSATLSIRLDSSFTPFDKIGIYSLGKNHSLSLTGMHTDSTLRVISAKIKTFGQFLLAADTSRPFLEITRPKQGAILADLKEIRLSLNDSLSGFGSDRNIRLFVDSTFVVPEWDPERHLVFGHPYWRIKPGQHKIVAIVRDNAGNITKKSVIFTIHKKKVTQ